MKKSIVFMIVLMAMFSSAISSAGTKKGKQEKKVVSARLQQDLANRERSKQMEQMIMEKEEGGKKTDKKEIKDVGSEGEGGSCH